MNKVEIFNETNEEIKELEIIKKIVKYALKEENVKKSETNIIIVNNKKIHEINKNYRGIDRPTDVISFALEDAANFVVSDVRILGDIYISIDKVREQADSYGHSFLREFAFLAVHGILHLLGYDHMVKEEEEIMFRRQEEILNAYGITRES